jgi:hypothetical protein
MKTFFDPIAHQYFIDDRPVVSVTQTLQEVFSLKYWHATDWHRDRGTVIHACAALIARGVPFEFDPQVKGQIEACYKFFADMKPEVLEVEQQLFSERYHFGGTLDLRCKIGGKEFIIDWKSSVCEMGEVQIGGYAIERPTAKWGMVVALKEDGRYRAGTPFKLDRARNEFLSVLTVYNIKRRWKLLESKEDADEN